jgi:hypothetical protein
MFTISVQLMYKFNNFLKNQPLDMYDPHIYRKIDLMVSLKKRCWGCTKVMSRVVQQSFILYLRFKLIYLINLNDKILMTIN